MTSPRVIYLGIGTEKSEKEVGGWSKVDQMGLRDALIYDTATRKYHNYTKSNVADLIAKLQTADLIVGFNQLNFDYKVLSTYSDKDLETLPNFDMLNKIEQTLNFRVSRDNLAANTLDSFKNEKAYTNVTERVETNKKLFAHACKEGYLFYENKRFGGKDRCNTSNWAETARNLSQKNKFLAEAKVISEKNTSKNTDNSIPNAPTVPIDIWKDTVDIKIEADQIDTGNKSDIKEHQHTSEHWEYKSSITKVSNKTQFTEIARQVYDQTKNRHARAWYAYNNMCKLGHVTSFHQFMNAIGRVSNSTSPKNNIKRNGSRYPYIDRSGTLVSEWVNDHIDVRNIKEELARGI